jgi:hypothetical protein
MQLTEFLNEPDITRLEKEVEVCGIPIVLLFKSRTAAWKMKKTHSGKRYGQVHTPETTEEELISSARNVMSVEFGLT